MKTGTIDASAIQSMLEQLRAAARGITGATPARTADGGARGAERGGFAAALKESLDRVNASQTHAQTLSRSFAMGDDNVSLSDVMIASQKASIQFQATVQVRNRMVAAYQDVMGMAI